MRLLITGGTGFIGRHLVKSLLADDHQITVLSRQETNSVQQILGSEVKTIQSISALTRDARFDGIINLAGEGILDRRWTPSRKKILVESRVGVTTELVNWIVQAQHKPSIFISGSAIGIYGSSIPSANEPVNCLPESSNYGKDFSARLCVDWEKVAESAEECGVRVCRVRTGVVLHPAGGALQKMLLPFKLGIGGVVGTGRQMFSWIHMDDMVSLLKFLLYTDSVSGAYNATAPEPVSNRVFTKTFAETLSRPAVIPVPSFVLKTLLGEGATMLLEGQAVVPERSQSEGFEFRYPKLDQALKSLLHH